MKEILKLRYDRKLEHRYMIDCDDEFIYIRELEPLKKRKKLLNPTT